jgi:IclR family pca regulon transcriptional regulator
MATIGQRAEGDQRDGDRIAGLAKGLAVIEAFDRNRDKLTIAEVARLTGLQRATARRCLLTLSKLGYADFDGKFFRLTPRILRLGYAYLASTPLSQIVQPFLEQLSAATHESCSASTLDGGEIVYIARAAQRRIMSINLGVGSRLPAYCTSMARVLLAHIDQADLERALAELPANPPTRFTATEPAKLRRLIERARRDGYALVDQELEIGLRSIAVPIFNGTGTALAAMNIGVQAQRLSPPVMIKTLLPRLLDAQGRLRQLLR